MTKKKTTKTETVEETKNVSQETPVNTEAVEKLDTLAKDAAEEPAEGAFMEPKKKRTYKKRKKVVEDETALPNAVDIEKTKGYVRPVFGMISNLGVKLAETQEAALGPNEMEICVDAAAQCVNQYLPNVLGEHAALVVLSLTLTNWGVRVAMLRAKRLEELRAQKRAMEATAPLVS